MNDFLLLEGESINFVWDAVQQQQLVFHPTIAPDGQFDFEKFYASKKKKPFILFIDRNILSSLLTLCRDGVLKDNREFQLLGLIITWAKMNGIAISAGLAIQERASHLHSQNEALVELQKFFEAYDAYPGQMWLYVAEGRIAEIPPIIFSQKPAPNITATYAEGGDHYDMAVASLLHAVQLFRNKAMKPVEKIQEFFKWTCDHLLVGEYLLVYVTLLFTGQEGVRAPKNANSNDIKKIISGCENQAWDISYLTKWSTLYSDTESYPEEFLFATNDILLKRIFINKNGPYGLNGLLFQLLSEKEYIQITNYIGDRMRNRVKPDFGDDPHSYFHNLIDEEKRQLSALLDEGKDS